MYTGLITFVPAVCAAAPVPQRPRRTGIEMFAPDTVGAPAICMSSLSTRIHDTKSRVFSECALAAVPVPRELMYGHVAGSPAGANSAGDSTTTVVAAAVNAPVSVAAVDVGSPLELTFDTGGQNVASARGAFVSRSA